MKILQREIFRREILCKTRKICYNRRMRKKDEEQRGLVASLIGEKTPTKTSGVSYSLLACAFFVAALLIGFFPRDKAPQVYLYLSYLAAPAAFAVVAIWYFRSEKLSVKAFVKEQACPIKYYGIALLMQVGLLSLGELNGLFLGFLEKFGYENSAITLPSVDGFGLVGVLLTVALLPAIFEELFFRGIFLRGIQGFSLVGRLLLCGGLFALYHQNPAQTVYQFICGAAFAFVAIRAGSFFPTVLSHFFNNALIIVLYALGVESYPTPAYIVVLVVSAVCLAAACALLVLDKKGEKRETPKGEYKSFFSCASLGVIAFGLIWLLTLITGF